jgi:hypothetical protein
MRRSRLLAIAGLLTALSALPQEPATLSRQPLFTLLNTPEHQWVFNHICFPLRVIGQSGYTNGDFVAAYFEVTKLRWEVSQEALRRGDENASMRPLALILHGVIDLYWPNRVERNQSGAITRFRDCDDLGNLPGVLREEKGNAGWSRELKERTTNYEAQVIRSWKERRSFEEVASILRSGPMRFSEEHASIPLEKK